MLSTVEREQALPLEGSPGLAPPPPGGASFFRVLDSLWRFPETLRAAAEQSIGHVAAPRHISRSMSTTHFVKMHGLGNDFVVIDARRAAFPLDAARAHAVADRKTGIGCDQLIVIEPPRDAAADVFMRIHNADGGEVAACGNATRCIATLVMAERGAERVVVE